MDDNDDLKDNVSDVVVDRDINDGANTTNQSEAESWREAGGASTSATHTCQYQVCKDTRVRCVKTHMCLVMAPQLSASDQQV